MISWRSWLKLMHSLSPRDQIKVLLSTGSVFLCIPLIFTLNWEASPIPSSGPWVMTHASVNSAPRPIESDPSLYSFTIKYQTREGRAQVSRVYAEKFYYDASGIGTNTVLTVEVEYIDGEPVTRRLTTPQGLFLYDPNLRLRVIERVNYEILKFIASFWVLALACFAAGCVVFFRQKKQSKDSTQSSSL